MNATRLREGGASASRLPMLTTARLLRAVLIGGVFTMAARPLFDADLWWHLANGRLILRDGIPTRDVYSWTAEGHHWVVQEWLAEVAMFVLHRAGGVAALFVAAGAIAALTIALIERALRRNGLRSTEAVALGTVLALLSSWAWGPRPQLVNFLFAAVVVEVLARYRTHPSRSAWWLLGLLMLWANLHNSYIGGVGLVLLFAGGETLRRRVLQGSAPVLGTRDVRRLWLIGALGPLAGLLTPFGVHTVTFALRVVGSAPIQARLLEWQSPEFHRLPGMMLLVVLALLMLAGPVAGLRQGREERPLLGALIAADLLLLAGIGLTSPDFHTLLGRGLVLLILFGVAAGALVTPSELRADATELLLGLGGVALALHALRFTGMLAVAGAPLAARSLRALRDSFPRRATAAAPAHPGANEVRLNWGIAIVLAVLAAIRVATGLTPSRVDAELARKQPVKAVSNLLAGRPSPPLFNFYDFGGYLIWRAPEYAVFIDGRAEVYGNELFGQYLELQDLEGDWRARLEARGVQTVLMPSNSPMGQELVDHGWFVHYQDERAYVVSRDAP